MYFSLLFSLFYFAFEPAASFLLCYPCRFLFFRLFITPCLFLSSCQLQLVEGHLFADLTTGTGTVRCLAVAAQPDSQIHTLLHKQSDCTIAGNCLDWTFIKWGDSIWAMSVTKLIYRLNNKHILWIISVYYFILPLYIFRFPSFDLTNLSKRYKRYSCEFKQILNCFV